MQKIKKDDEVIIITGKDKGKKGKVLRVINKGFYKKTGKLLDTQRYALVEGINMVVKHEKPNPNLNKTGGIARKEKPIHISNIAIFNPTTKKADRVGIKILEDGRKVRIFKSTGEVVEV